MSDIIYTSCIPQKNNTAFNLYIDSAKLKTRRDFLAMMCRELSFPEDDQLNYDGYLDWMRDLSWIENKEIQIVFLNSDLLFSQVPSEKKLFIRGIEDTILPFWNNDAGYVFDSDNERKNINFYLVQNSSEK